jgi:hypothetical protein
VLIVRSNTRKLTAEELRKKRRLFKGIPPYGSITVLSGRLHLKNFTRHKSALNSACFTPAGMWWVRWFNDFPPPGVKHADYVILVGRATRTNDLQNNILTDAFVVKPPEKGNFRKALMRFLTRYLLRPCEFMVWPEQWGPQDDDKN